MTLRWLSQCEADLPIAEDWLTPREARWAAGMRFLKRRSEFKLGRWTAKRALARAQGLRDDLAGLARVEIDRAPDGAPAPLIDGAAAPVAISMTDRAGWAVCVVGPPGVSLGCDLELVEPRSQAFVTDYLTEPEQRVVAAAEVEWERHLLANLMWCGKESALKVLRTGLRRDTRSVEVTFPGVPPQDGWAPLLVRAVEGTPFPGWWRRYGSFLLTVAATEELPPPASMTDPPGLEHGIPTHSWWSPQP